MSDDPWGGIPERMRGGIMRSSLNTAFRPVTSDRGDLQRSARGVPAPRASLFNHVAFCITTFYNHAPIASWGSPDWFDAWVARGGNRGKRQ